MYGAAGRVTGLRLGALILAATLTYAPAAHVGGLRLRALRSAGAEKKGGGGDEDVSSGLPAAMAAMPRAAHSVQPRALFQSSQGSQARLHELQDPWWTGNQHVTLVTVETRPGRTKVDGITTLGEGAAWNGTLGKLQIMLPWLRSKEMDDPNHIVIFVDGDDTVYGGCDEAQFLRDYHEIVKNSHGSEVVVAAERGCFDSPWGTSCPIEWNQRRGADPQYPDVPLWAKRNWTPWAGGIFNPRSPLDETGQMRFLNSGIIVGPVGKLVAMYSEVLRMMVNHEYGSTPKLSLDFKSHMHGNRQVSDQYFVNRYFVDRMGNGSSTLDYTGLLGTCVYGLQPEKLLELREGSNGRKQMFNMATNRTQCFVHMNGPQKRYATALSKWQHSTNQSRPWEVGHLSPVLSYGNPMSPSKRV